MRLASSSFMYQGETMGSGDFVGSLCTGDRQNSRFCILQRGQKGSRANSSVFLAKPALKARGQRASRAKFIREIPDIPSRARPKTSRPSVARSFMDLVAALLSQPRVTSVVRSWAILSVVFRGSAGQASSPSTRTEKSPLWSENIYLLLFVSSVV